MNALRAELTHELVNHSDSAYVVNDRSEEILSYLRQELNYQESGMVREDQLVKIGEHFGANYLCVVSVTKYQEYNQYFFECNLVDIASRTIVKHSYYPKSGMTVSQLDPQTQLTIGKDLASQLGIKAATRAAAATASTTVVTRQKSVRSTNDEPLNTTIKHIGDYYTGEHVYRGRKYESTHGRQYIIGYLDYSGEHGLAYLPVYPTYWSTAEEDTYVGAYIADSEQLLKIYRNNSTLKLYGLFWTLEVTKKGKPGNADDTYKVVDFSNGKIIEKKDCKMHSTQGLYIIVF